MNQTNSADELVLCPVCGDENPPGSNFCQSCGSDLRVTPPTPEPPGPAASPSRSDETVVIEQEPPAAETPAAESGAPAHEVAFRTDPGRKPGANQDAGGVWTWMRQDGLPATLIVVADGVSAGRKSEEASRLVVDLIADHLTPAMQNPDNDAEALRAALLTAAQEANRKVSERPHHTIATADTTTLVAAICLGDIGGGVWCGDSRVYQLAAGEIVQLTRDHSWAEAVISHGLMSPEQAAHDPRARMITRWVGPSDREDAGFETFEFKLEPNDVVVCCTDGLYMYFAPPAGREEEMAQILRSNPHQLQQAAETLVDLALERGGHDNITVGALALVGGEEERSTTVRIPSLRSQPAGETMRLEPDDATSR